MIKTSLYKMEGRSKSDDFEDVSLVDFDENEGNSDQEDDTDYFDAVFSKVKTQCQIEKLEDLPWFHGDLSRNAAEALLLSNGVEGSYLMRNTELSCGQYTVSVRCRNSIKHYYLEMTGCTGCYKFGMGEFDTLKELLDHFECMPVLGNLSGVSVILKYPYLKDVPEPSTFEKVICHSEVGKNSATKSNEEAEIIQPDLHIASKEGYLVKRGAIHKNWKKRWFQLKKNQLQYFNRQKAGGPLRIINLEDALSVDEDFCDNKRNCFRLVLPERTFYFLASSYDEQRSWIDILQWKIDYYRSRKVSLPTNANESFVSFPSPRK